MIMDVRLQFRKYGKKKQYYEKDFKIINPFKLERVINDEYNWHYAVAQQPGIYFLFWLSEFVYVGISDRSIKKRIQYHDNHSWGIQNKFFDQYSYLTQDQLADIFKDYSNDAIYHEQEWLLIKIYKPKYNYSNSRDHHNLQTKVISMKAA